MGALREGGKRQGSRGLEFAFADGRATKGKLALLRAMRPSEARPFYSGEW